jgi:hypothetical protein
MSFDPNLPQENTDLDAAQVRAQFNALKQLIDNLPGGSTVGLAPVGSIVAWQKSFPNTPALPVQFAECNGQVLSDAQSPFHGATLPDLNGANRFLRGAGASGGTGGADTHSHDVDLSAGAGDFAAGTDAYAAGSGHVNTADASSLPSYYEVVWVMRVK